MITEKNNIFLCNVEMIPLFFIKIQYFILDITIFQIRYYNILFCSKFLLFYSAWNQQDYCKQVLDYTKYNFLTY